MKVLGAGFGKTGTFTLKIALEKLGFSPCYNFGDVLINYKKGDADMWNNYMEGKADMDWHKIFADYKAAVDAPANLYYREIIAAFPDIKVILTTRDPDKWWDSLVDTLEKHDAAVGPFKFLPSFNAFQQALENLGKVNPVDPPTKENYIKMLLQHNENVKNVVPPDRLLVYTVQEGWEPLCEFLGVPVPEEPFPWVNKGFAEGEDMIKKALLRDLVKFFLPYLAGIVIVILVLVLLFK
jgi:hypothetical protein